jgi:hypothetical protein
MIYDKYRGKNTSPQCVKMRDKVKNMLELNAGGKENAQKISQ